MRAQLYPAELAASRAAGAAPADESNEGCEQHQACFSEKACGAAITNADLSLVHF